MREVLHHTSLASEEPAEHAQPTDGEVNGHCFQLRAGVSIFSCIYTYYTTLVIVYRSGNYGADELVFSLNGLSAGGQLVSNSNMGFESHPAETPSFPVASHSLSCSVYCFPFLVILG